MFSETRYALNGDLRVAYRTSREGPRDIVFVPNCGPAVNVTLRGNQAVCHPAVSLTTRLLPLSVT